MSGARLRRLHADGDTFIVWLGPRSTRDGIYRKSLGIHIDFPWSVDVRKYGCPKRINLHLYNWFILIGAKSQAWSSKTGNSAMKWRRITWHPSRELRCRKMFQAERFGFDKDWECARLAGHPGDHA